MRSGHPRAIPDRKPITGRDPKLRNPEKGDFHPTQNSPLIDAGLPPKGVKELGDPPCSEEEFMALAGRWRKMKPSERNRQAAEWGAWARAKYARVIEKYGR